MAAGRQGGAAQGIPAGGGASPRREYPLEGERNLRLESGCEV
jgi:hypothetical protein